MVTTPIDLYLIRHGTDVSEYAERFGDERLTTDGTAQSEKLASLMEQRKITRIYSSPAQPAMETATMLSEKSGIPIQQDPRLRSRDLGQAEGMTYKEVRNKFAHVLQKSQFDIDWKFPDGESNGDVFDRSQSFAQSMIETSSGKMERIAIVSHTLVLNYLIYGLQGIGFQNGLFYLLQGGSFAVLERGQMGFQMKYFGKI